MNVTPFVDLLNPEAYHDLTNPFAEESLASSPVRVFQRELENCRAAQCNRAAWCLSATVELICSGRCSWVLGSKVGNFGKPPANHQWTSSYFVVRLLKALDISSVAFPLTVGSCL